jgi:predicted lipoprotein with Yx(FWY)xxD motif
MSGNYGRRRAGVVLAGGALAATLGSALAAPVPAGGSVAGHTFTIKTVTVPKVGTVLSTASGLTLYRFTADPMGKSTCTGACAQVWIPILLPKGDHLKGPHGIKGLSTIHVAHGRAQVAFDGAALYRFSGDTKKGQAKGQGVEDEWFALDPGTFKASVTTAPMTTPTTTTPNPGTAASPAPAAPSVPPAEQTPPPPPPTTMQPAPTTTTMPPVTGGAGF